MRNFSYLFFNIQHLVLGYYKQNLKTLPGFRSRKINGGLHMVILLVVMLSAVTPVRSADRGSDCVVLLHGLARTEKSMAELEHHLEYQGFCVVNAGYPSREKTIQDLSVETIPEALSQCRALETQRIHFVTHSMGGILVRYYLECNTIKDLGRVVMLSPPNRGSEAVDKLGEMAFFEWINGPAGKQLGTGETSLPKSLSPPDYDVGIITGDRSINPILSLLIPGEDDGKVSVENAKLAGMKDFLVVDKTHPFIMNDEAVIEQVIYFLENGVFKR